MNICPTQTTIQTFIKHDFIILMHKQEEMYKEAEIWIKDMFTNLEVRLYYTYASEILHNWIDTEYYPSSIAFANEEDFLVFKLKFSPLLARSNTE